MDNRAVLIGLGLGAAVAYIFDPAAGGRRRALVRDKMIHGAKLTGRGLDATLCDLANRTGGIAAATRGRFSGEQVDDDRLVERVRAKLGRVCSHARAIDVGVADGRVTLCGRILVDEVDDVLDAVAAVRGVRSVTNQLEPHESSEGIPSLQGEGRVAGPSFDLFQRNWAPATRALVGVSALAAAGVAMAAYARR